MQDHVCGAVQIESELVGGKLVADAYDEFQKIISLDALFAPYITI